MRCDSCDEAEATIHQIHVNDNQIEHVQLCESCAREQNSELSGSETEGSGVLSEIEAGRTETDTCPECGLQLKELKKIGKVGCEECYSTFRDQFESLVHRIHGAEKHDVEESEPVTTEGRGGLGKVPSEKKLKMLERRLQERVEAEEYEQAAKLRDRIEELKEENDDGSTV